ncbi:MAG: methionyl-tRNA formyltransferase, partial [Verrucomicrobia bacterium]|nr:methionyl-tRNA formyltransferase [Verrucomicrobiota bacterium]
MRIVWMGAGEIGLPSLRWLIEESGHDLVGVFTQPDRPVGRKQILTATAIKALAIEAEVPVFQPETLRKNLESFRDLQTLAPDLIVVMAYGCLLPQEVIDAPSIACINLHASLLPLHRG